MALATIGAGLSIASSVLGISGGLEGNKKAKKAAERQADLTFAQRQEEIRRMEGEAKFITGMNKAQIGASGVQFGGSAMTHLEDVRRTLSEDIAWRKGAAWRERRAIREGAPGSAANFSTWATGISSIGATLLGYHSSRD